MAGGEPDAPAAGGGAPDTPAGPDGGRPLNSDEVPYDETPSTEDDPDATSTLEEMTELELEDELSAAGDSGDIDRLTEIADEMNRRQEENGQSDDDQIAIYERLIGRGVDDEHAVEQAFGVPIEQQRRERAISLLRDSYGYVAGGNGFDALSREAYRDYVRLHYQKAEDELGQALLTARGWRAVGDPKRLFSGPSAFARKWASEELRAWFDRNGRMTYAEYRAQLLGDAQAARDARHARTNESDYHQ